MVIPRSPSAGFSLGWKGRVGVLALLHSTYMNLMYEELSMPYHIHRNSALLSDEIDRPCCQSSIQFLRYLLFTANAWPTFFSIVVAVVVAVIVIVEVIDKSTHSLTVPTI